MCWRYAILLTLFNGMIDTRQYLLKARPGKGNNNCVLTSHCRASGGMAIFLGVSAAPERILLSKISYAPVQHSSLNQKVLLWHMIIKHQQTLLACLLVCLLVIKDPPHRLVRTCLIFSSRNWSPRVHVSARFGVGQFKSYLIPYSVSFPFPFPNLM